MNGYESLGYNIYPHLLTNFSIQYLPIYEKTIAEFERRHPEWKDTIYINDDVRDIHGVPYTGAKALWLSKDIGDLSEFWEIYRSYRQ